MSDIRIVDRATSYAEDVVEGRIIAGPAVRNQCRRHLHDLTRTDLFWDVKAGNRAVRWIETFCCLNTGLWDGKPFLLLPWQCFVVSSLFGWHKADRVRLKYREALVETSKGSGKSPLFAAIALYVWRAQKRTKAYVVFASPTMAQTQAGFKGLITMLKYSPALAKGIRMYGGEGKENEVFHQQSESWLKTMSADADAKSGFIITLAVIDELHEIRDYTLLDKIRLGFKTTVNPLLLLLTNAASDKTGPCAQYTERAIECAAKGARGEKCDDSFFTYVAMPDDNDLPFEDEACWIKSSPSLPDTPGYDYIRAEVEGALGFPPKESEVRRLIFSQSTNSTQHWIGEKRWDSRVIKDDIWKTIPLKDYPLRLGLDLSLKEDMTSLAMAWQSPDEHYYLDNICWIPGDTMQRRQSMDNVPYDVWKKQNYIEAPPGEYVDYDAVARHVKRLIEEFNVKSLAFDRAYMKDFKLALDHEGVKHYTYRKDEAAKEGLMLIDHGQGEQGLSNENILWMPRSISFLETLFFKEKITIRHNPVHTFNSSCAMLFTRPSKNRVWINETGYKDAIVADSMALGSYHDLKEPKLKRRSIWDTDEEVKPASA